MKCREFSVGQIFRRPGLGLGLTMWDLSNMLVGWFIGHFGLLGVTKEHTQHPVLNYVGLVLASVSLVFFSISSVINNPESETKPKERGSKQSIELLKDSLLVGDYVLNDISCYTWEL